MPPSFPDESLRPTTPFARRLVVMGVSGAGKSLIGERLAAVLGAPFLEGDALHPPENVAKMAAGIPLDDVDRAGWLSTIAAHIAEARARGAGLVVACSALKRRYRDVLRGGDPALTFVFLEGERDVIATRLTSRRGHFMPLSLLDSQFEALEEPARDERTCTVDVSHSPDAVVAAILTQLAMDLALPGE